MNEMPPTSDSAAPPGRVPAVLVVDDEADLRELLSLTLLRLGLDVDTAESVSGARARLEQRRYSLCLTDMRLPDGTGLDLVATSRRRRARRSQSSRPTAAQRTRWRRSRPFRQARLYDNDYEHWQNAEDPLHYRAAGKSYKHLPMRSNGLPPPLEQMVIDISRNPGRRRIRQGFVEFVGSVTWLGEPFWGAAGVRKDVLLTQDWLQVDELPGGAVRIRAAEEPFTTDTGEAG